MKRLRQHGKNETLHRCSVRHSFPHLVDMFCVGFNTNRQIRVDDSKTFFDVQDVFELITNSTSHSRKLVSAWRSGSRGAQLDRLIKQHSPTSPDFPPLLPSEIIRLKWTLVLTSSGRSRVCATARAFVVILNIITTKRVNTNLEIAKQWFRTLCDVNTFPRTVSDDRRFRENSKLVPDSLRNIPDTAYENWLLTSEELKANSEHEKDEKDVDGDCGMSMSEFSSSVVSYPSSSATQTDDVNSIFE